MKLTLSIGSGLIFAVFVMSITASARKADPPDQWTFSRGMNLRQIAYDSYGNRAFARMVALFNQVDPRRIPAGAIIRTPPLLKMFEELGLIPEYRDVFLEISNVVYEYPKLLDIYRPLRRKAKGYGQAGQLKLPPELKAGFIKAADSLKRAAHQLEHLSKIKSNVPHQTLRQLQQSELCLRELASGRMDGYGYDEDMVWQHLAHALANAVAWSREQ